jgi:superfamily I DNA/RNA helicase
MINFNHLNPEQKKAVEFVDKPVLLLAGAGSGKTRVITYRIAHLVSNLGVPAREILALTFTNKASGEMEERVRFLLKQQARGITVATFHSLCVRILRQEITLLNYSSDFVIFDTASQQATLKTIYEDEEINSEVYNLKATFFEFMAAKGQGKTPDHFLNQTENKHAQTVGLLFKEYNKTLKGYNAIDFEDILYLTLELFQRFPEEMKKWSDKYSYIMIDEYQDTNRVQYQLIKHLSARTKKLCVVGDDDQSIYGWRGADIRNILDFKSDFPQAKVIKLEQNYRSTEVILKAANDVIKNNSGRMEKSLWTKGSEGEKIKWILQNEQRGEIDEVVNHMNVYKYRTGMEWSDFAFLYRSNFQSRLIEERLREAGIPYQIIGGIKFFDRKEIQDCLAYMRFFHNLKNETSLYRIVNYPKRALGKTSMTILTQERIERGWSLFEMMERAETIENLKPAAKNSIQSFVDLVHKFCEELDKRPFFEVFKDFFTHIDMKGEIEKDEKNDIIRERKVQNYLEFINSLYMYNDRRLKQNQSATLADFLEYVSLFADTDDLDTKKPQVTLLTVHSAKGLEYSYVALVGLTDGQFPNHKAITDDLVEEERRLFYVAITRAREMLVMSMSKTRMMYGEFQRNIPSRFITEINPELFDTPPFEKVDLEKQAQNAINARDAFFERMKMNAL